MPYQVSVFAENKPGKIEKVTKILSANNINIRAITISDAGDYGIIKLLLDNPERGCDLLKENTVPATLKQIIAVKIKDQVDGLHKIAEILSRNLINVQDAYGFIVEKDKHAVLIFQTDNISKSEGLLKNAGLTILSDSELYTL